MSSDRVSFDPTLRDSGIPPTAPALPVGTLDELQELGLETAHVPCCAKPNKAGGVRGCFKFGECPLSIKGKPVKEMGGPRRIAWERIFRGRPIRRVEGECWRLADDKKFVEDNGGAVRIVAAEPGLGYPNTYKRLTGVAVRTYVDPVDNESKKALAKPGEFHLPNVAREDMVVDMTVRPFVRPSENVGIATDVITADVLRQERERIQKESIGTALGVDGASSPLDKRNKRAGKDEREGA